MTLRKWHLTIVALLVVSLSFMRPAAAQSVDHTDVVRAARAAAIAAGVDVDSSECARFEVTKATARLLAGEGAGLLEKLSGNRCEDRSVDIIAYPSGRIIDILGAGPDGPNTAHWMELTPADPTRWRAPFGVAPAPAPTPDPSPTPDPPATVEDHDAILHRIEAQLEHLSAAVSALRERLDENTEQIERLGAAEHEQTRHEIKAFRDAAGSALKKLLEYVPAIVSSLGLLKK